MKRLITGLLVLILLLSMCACGSSAHEEQWVCSNCGKTASGKFCSNCGAAAEEQWICSNCGETSLGKFCSNCGAERDLDDNVPLESSSPQAEKESVPRENEPAATPSVASQYTFMHDRWNLYVATPISDTVIKVENWGRGYADESTPFKYDYDVCVIDTTDSSFHFQWLDKSHSAFSIFLYDEDNSYYWKEPSTVGFVKNPDIMKSSATDSTPTYTFKNDKWDIYAAIKVSDTAIKVEHWYRVIADDEHPFTYDKDLIAFSTESPSEELAFSWVDSEQSALSIKIKDEENSHWVREDAPVFVLNSGFIDSHIDEKKPTYTFQHDKWNMYVAIKVSENVIVVERWYRTIADDEHPFKYDGDLFTINLSAPAEELSFSWMDNSQSAFSIIAKDEENSRWVEESLAQFTLNSQFWIDYKAQSGAEKPPIVDAPTPGPEPSPAPAPSPSSSIPPTPKPTDQSEEGSRDTSGLRSNYFYQEYLESTSLISAELDKVNSQVGDSYSGYADHSKDIMDWFTFAEKESEQFYSKIHERGISSYREISDIAKAGDYSDWDSAMDELYSDWDDILDAYYDYWDGVMDEVYDRYDAIITEGYSSDYSKASSDWSAMYRTWSDTWGVMYHDWSDAWSLFYKTWSKMWSSFYNGNYDVDAVITEISKGV